MSWWEYCPDPFDDYWGDSRSDEDGGGYGGVSQLPKVCAKCGHSPLIWSEVHIGVFRLYDQKLGKLHTCPPALDFK